MEMYQIIIVGLVGVLVVVISVVMFLAYRNGQNRIKDQQRIRTIEQANDSQQKLIYLLKSRSA